MTLFKTQRIFFRGSDGAKRAQKFADELNSAIGRPRCNVEGATVVMTRDTEIGVKEITRADIFGPDANDFHGASLGTTAPQSANATPRV